MEKKYFIYRILVISQQGGRHSSTAKIHTGDIEETRKNIKDTINEWLPIKRVLLSYHEF